MYCNNQYAKSCIRVVNSTDQAFTATPSPLLLEGTPVVESGCSLCLNASSIQVNKSGLYHISADVIVTPTAAGLLTFQAYNNGIAIPSALSQETVAAGSAYTIHIETDLAINTCCVSRPVITFELSGVAGNVNNLSAGVVKLA